MKAIVGAGLSIISLAALAACSADGPSTAPVQAPAAGSFVMGGVPGGGNPFLHGPPPGPALGASAFVIGDLEPHASTQTVNFWGAQWWMNNTMSAGASAGVASFKGFADNVVGQCGGTWTTRPGNSSNPPSSLPVDPVTGYMALIVTSSVVKSGSSISGNIKEIVVVQPDPGYAGNPGHAGTGKVISVTPCP